MVAGRGIVHSERTRDELRRSGSALHGIQSWLALPQTHEETAPDFRHHPAASLPEMEQSGARMRLIAGAAFGAVSPVQTFAPMFYLDVVLDDEAVLPLPGEYEERAVYVAIGMVVLDGERYEAGSMLVLKPGSQPRIIAQGPARLMLLGGAPLDGERYLWWNFVSSSKDRIEQAKTDWKSGRFTMVPGDPEFIPLPEA